MCRDSHLGKINLHQRGIVGHTSCSPSLVLPPSWELDILAAGSYHKNFPSLESYKNKLPLPTNRPLISPLRNTPMLFLHHRDLNSSEPSSCDHLSVHGINNSSKKLLILNKPSQCPLEPSSESLGTSFSLVLGRTSRVTDYVACETKVEINMGCLSV